MNKAEEQYQYRFGRCKAQYDLMTLADNITKRDFVENIKEIIESAEILNARKKKKDNFSEGKSDYNSEILRLIENNVITDWPSFVTHMTGETYER